MEAQAQGLGAIGKVDVGEGTPLISFEWHIYNFVEKFVSALLSKHIPII